VGSVAKTLTALGMLVLAEQNQVNFGHSINAYLPVPHSDYDDITIPQLLSHTSGISNHAPIFGGFFVLTDEEELKATCDLALPPPYQHTCADPDHPGIHPRSAYYTYYPNNTFSEAAVSGRYSNVNFMLLGTIIDMLTRHKAEFGNARGYENFVWRRVCLEAEMLSPCLMAHWRGIKNLARGYRLVDLPDGRQETHAVPYPGGYWGWEGPPGGWTMTIGDLCRLMIGINRNRIVGQTTRESLLLNPQSGELSNLELEARYGSGVFVFDDNKNGQGYLHHGDINGFTARFTYYRSHDVGVALLFNREDVTKSDIGALGIRLRDLFTASSAATATSFFPRQPQSAVERLLQEYDRDIVRLIKQVNDGAVEAAGGNRAISRFLISREGENGKRLLRCFFNREYERAAEIALRILEDRQPRPFYLPTDQV
jgi:CubicO group peptidase (beta-lactamase class C family)